MNQANHDTSQFGNTWAQFSVRSMLLVSAFVSVAFALCRWLDFRQPVIPALGYWLGTNLAIMVGLRNRRTSLVVRGFFAGMIGGGVGTALPVVILCGIAIRSRAVYFDHDGLVIAAVPLFGAFFGGLLGMVMSICFIHWSLKAWCGLMIFPSGSQAQKEQQAASKRRVLRMDFHTFRQSLIQIPAQIIRRSRQLIYRLLSYRPSIEPMLLIQDNVVRPLRC